MSPPSTVLLREVLHDERDVIRVRRHARHVAELLGLTDVERLRLPVAIFAIAQNLYRHTFAGSVEFAVTHTDQPLLIITFSGRGEGVPTWQRPFEPQRRHADDSNGLLALLRDFEIETYTDHVAMVFLRRPLSHVWDEHQLQQMAAALGDAPMTDAFSEIAHQNSELIDQHLELQRRQSELQYLGRELEDTNRGVVALYAEVEDKAARLRQADAMKSRFLSNMSHEFRTPLGSIRALAQLLLDRLDGDLTDEQEKQVQLILGSASELAELVNDLLDLAKIEAGKVDVHLGLFSVAEMFSALRGMLGPLFAKKDVQLIFSVEDGIETLTSDEAKISQILRNFISNALKFTKQGQIVVRASRESADSSVRLSVSDTGIGIASKDLEVIFEEFTQIENPMQRHAKGTGLGLPLCRQLANLLGATLEVASTYGEGSTFSLVMPPPHQDAGDSGQAEDFGK